MSPGGPRRSGCGGLARLALGGGGFAVSSGRLAVPGRSLPGGRRTLLAAAMGPRGRQRPDHVPASLAHGVMIAHSHAVRRRQLKHGGREVRLAAPRKRPTRAGRGRWRAGRERWRAVAGGRGGGRGRPRVVAARAWRLAGWSGERVGGDPRLPAVRIALARAAAGQRGIEGNQEGREMPRTVAGAGRGQGACSRPARAQRGIEGNQEERNAPPTDPARLPARRPPRLPHGSRPAPQGRTGPPTDLPGCCGRFQLRASNPCPRSRKSVGTPETPPEDRGIKLHTERRACGAGAAVSHRSDRRETPLD